jgi:hypothetical protein
MNMAKRTQDLDTTVFIQGLLIGAMIAVLSRGTPNFKRELLIELKSLKSDHPRNKDNIAAAVKLIEDAI